MFSYVVCTKSNVTSTYKKGKIISTPLSLFFIMRTDYYTCVEVLRTTVSSLYYHPVTLHWLDEICCEWSSNQACDRSNKLCWLLLYWTDEPCCKQVCMRPCDWSNELYWLFDDEFYKKNKLETLISLGLVDHTGSVLLLLPNSASDHVLDPIFSVVGAHSDIHLTNYCLTSIHPRDYHLQISTCFGCNNILYIFCNNSCYSIYNTAPCFLQLYILHHLSLNRVQIPKLSPLPTIICIAIYSHFTLHCIIAFA